MTVQDCMREIRKAIDAIYILDKYSSGEPGIADQYVKSIREILCEYIDMIKKQNVE